MGVAKQYTYAEVETAIKTANEHFFNTLIRVRNDVSVEDWGKGSVKVSRDAAGKPVDPLEWKGRGSDVGHSFRHVNDTAIPNKSVYQDDRTAIYVSMEVLNSSTGQSKLAALDQAQSDQQEPDSSNNRKIVADISGEWYGRPEKDGPLKRITKACCEVMKLSANTLWIHSTYPKKFQ